MAGCDDPKESNPRRINRAPETSEAGAPVGGTLFFHSSRAERRAMRLDQPFESSKGWLRGNRTMIILLIDVGIVAVLAFIYLFFIQPAGTRAIIDGYRFDGRAFRFDGRVYVTVTVTATDDHGTRVQPLIGAAFEQPPTDAPGPTVQDLAPTTRGQTRELPLVGPDQGQERATMRVWVGTRSATFAVAIRR